jgi:pullulanase/glycogen debranching enzyme
VNSPGEQLDRLLLAGDQIRVGLVGNLRDYAFVDRTGTTATGAQVPYGGAPTGYTEDPQEAITYVSAHDNEMLYDALTFKLPQATSMAQRTRAQIVALSTVALGQGVAFFHAGTELLRSKSLDRNSFDSGDWFNRLFYDYASNNFGVGLPPRRDNEGKWPYMRPLLADPALRPARRDIEWTVARFAELLRIRRSSPLFRLGTAAEIQARVRFENTGPDQVPGVIVMRISDEVGADLDPALRSVTVVINAGDDAQRLALPALRDRTLRLHPVQRRSGDRVVRRAGFDARSGRLRVPPRTTAVFVEAG